jgi:hypothetical protein
MGVDLKQLSSFLAEANRSGYASGQDDKWKKESDGSKTIVYQRDPWFFHDNYFGGEPYGGREVVFHKDKPVFMMVYYGRIIDKSSDKKFIYLFLRNALKLFPGDLPFRGPPSYQEEKNGKKIIYQNKWIGGIDCFSGKEKIYIDDRKVYEAEYSGGLVDR